MRIIRVDCDVTSHLLIIYFAFVKYLRKNGNKKEATQKLFIDFNKAYDSVRRAVLYNIVTEFILP